MPGGRPTGEMQAFYGAKQYMPIPKAAAILPEYEPGAPAPESSPSAQQVHHVPIQVVVEKLKEELGIEEGKLGSALTEIMTSLFGDDDRSLTAKEKADTCADECGLALRVK